MKNRIGLAIALMIVGSLLLAATAAAQGSTSVSRGGLLYDKWWKVVGAAEPTTDHPLWATQTTNARSGADSWRCKECHGWDYQGKDGAYASGSHSTGFPGVLNAGQSMDVGALESALKGGTNPDHDFSSVMDATAIHDLAVFLDEALIDDRQVIDYATKAAKGADVASGEALYSLCVGCHGADGKTLNFGSADDPEYLGGLANGNPWETLHKARFGHPASAMPSTIDLGWSVQDAVDVLAYAQSLEAPEPTLIAALPESGGSTAWTSVAMLAAGLLTFGLGLAMLGSQLVRRVRL